MYMDKSTFKTENAFIIFHRYPTPLFVKVGQNEAEELAWEDFLRTTQELFDQYADGAHTYESAFEEKCQKMTVEKENGPEGKVPVRRSLLILWKMKVWECRKRSRNST